MATYKLLNHLLCVNLPLVGYLALKNSPISLIASLYHRRGADINIHSINGYILTYIQIYMHWYTVACMYALYRQTSSDISRGEEAIVLYDQCVFSE